MSDNQYAKTTGKESWDLMVDTKLELEQQQNWSEQTNQLRCPGNNEVQTFMVRVNELEAKKDKALIKADGLDNVTEAVWFLDEFNTSLRLGDVLEITVRRKSL